MIRSNAQLTLKKPLADLSEKTASVIFDLKSKSELSAEISSENKYFAEIQNIKKALENIKSKESLSHKVVQVGSGNIVSKLFDACANVKIITSSVSMHLDKEWRNKLFKQIDLIHDPLDWDDYDSPIQGESFNSFIKWYIAENPNRSPGIGLTSTGNIIAAWVLGKNRLSIEFTPSEIGNWAVTQYTDGDIERASGHAKIFRLSDVLSPYNYKSFLYQ